MTFRYEKSWTGLFSDGTLKKINKYVQKGLIPLGTKRPFYNYSGEPKEDDIVYIPFDKVYNKNGEIKDPSTREAFNVLLLGASGDGKTLLIKNIWGILHEAGYYSVFIDPKSFSSGLAKFAWHNKRIPPETKPKGIKLKHYVPSHRIDKFKDADKYKIYSMKPYHLDKLNMWTSLRQTPNSADKILEVVKADPNIDVDGLIKTLAKKTDEKIFNVQAFNSANGKLISLKHSNFFCNDYKEINMFEDFKKGYAVCISYRSGDDEYTCLDIGEKIYKCNDYHFHFGNNIPILFLLDDASFFADSDKVRMSDNFAIDQIKHIGYNYRSNGLCNVLAVQSLKIINESVADSYPIKIISPLFNNPDSLTTIGIPKEVVSNLKTQGELLIDDKNKTMEWQLVHKKKVYRFFPFLPRCKHFKNG